MKTRYLTAALVCFLFALTSWAGAGNGAQGRHSPTPELAFAGSSPVATSAPLGTSFCTDTSELAFEACGLAAQEGHLIGQGICLNLSDATERAECEDEADETLAEEQELCADQLGARVDVCNLLGEERYDPDFDPANFVDPDEIGKSIEPNPFLSLIPGTRWVYEEEDERVTVVVLDKTKLIDGVTCRVVNDVVEVDGFLVEDTDDWFAQDVDGNIWYCGEEVTDFEVFEGDDPVEPELVAIDGSFKVGRDGAFAGLLVPAAPFVGQSYRQEFLLGEAEDTVEVLSVTGTESTPGASCDGNCLITLDFSALSPGAIENKYYAPGVGFFLETAPDGTRLELIEFTPGRVDDDDSDDEDSDDSSSDDDSSD